MRNPSVSLNAPPYQKKGPISPSVTSGRTWWLFVFPTLPMGKWWRRRNSPWPGSAAQWAAQGPSGGAHQRKPGCVPRTGLQGRRLRGTDEHKPRFPHNKILRYFLNCTAKRFNALRSKQTLTVLHPACSPTFLSQRRMSLGKSSSPRQTGRNTCVPVRFPARGAASTLFTPQRDVLGDDWQAER